MQLAGSVAVITGGASGLGATTATPGAPRRIRGPGATYRRECHAQRRDHPSGWRLAYGPALGHHLHLHGTAKAKEG
jgi:NAD(P)-dependent dehydrogenase (short-subunit alcohol dehydrogenase family)